MLVADYEWFLTPDGITAKFDAAVTIPIPELGEADENGLPIWPQIVAMDPRCCPFRFANFFMRALSVYKGRYTEKFRPDWRAAIQRILIERFQVSESRPVTLARHASG